MTTTLPLSDKLCTIETCRQQIPLLRIAMSPKAVTCSPECAVVHRKNLVRAAVRRYKQRLKEKALSAATT